MYLFIYLFIYLFLFFDVSCIFSPKGVLFWVLSSFLRGVRPCGTGSVSLGLSLRLFPFICQLSGVYGGVSSVPCFVEDSDAVRSQFGCYVAKSLLQDERVNGQEALNRIQAPPVGYYDTMSIHILSKKCDLEIWSYFIQSWLVTDLVSLVQNCWDRPRVFLFFFSGFGTLKVEGWATAPTCHAKWLKKLQALAHDFARTRHGQRLLVEIGLVHEWSQDGWSLNPQILWWSNGPIGHEHWQSWVCWMTCG